MKRQTVLFASYRNGTFVMKVKRFYPVSGFISVEYQEIFLLCCKKTPKNVLQGRKPFNSALI